MSVNVKGQTPGDSITDKRIYLAYYATMPKGHGFISNEFAYEKENYSYFRSSNEFSSPAYHQLINTIGATYGITNHWQISAQLPFGKQYIQYSNSDSIAPATPYHQAALGNFLIEIKHGKTWNDGNDYQSFSLENSFATENRLNIFKEGIHNKIAFEREHWFKKDDYYAYFFEAGLSTYYDGTFSWAEFEPNGEFGLMTQFHGYNFAWISVIQEGTNTIGEVGMESLFKDISIDLFVNFQLLGNADYYAGGLKFQFY